MPLSLSPEPGSNKDAGPRHATTAAVVEGTESRKSGNAEGLMIYGADTSEMQQFLQRGHDFLGDKKMKEPLPADRR
ncbi:MAG TPA: hypothetical protein VGX68_22635 [Thermoanaerobaculia bacterium]|nr:hypothetical protein [Thermoanaerobaculia bacterium]